MKAGIRVGIGGWVFPPWRGVLYPAGLAQARELAYASRQVTAIEINGTFYGSQKPESFRRWHDETPEDFIFSLKGPRFVTHRRDLATAGPSIERFLAIAACSNCATSSARSCGNSPRFCALTRRALAISWRCCRAKPMAARLRHVVEVRHPSFAAPAFFALLRQHKVAVAQVDDEKFPALYRNHRRFCLCPAAPLFAR